MTLLIVLIGTGTILVVLLLVLLVILSTNPPQNRKKVKEDIKKIKEQINSE